MLCILAAGSTTLAVAFVDGDQEYTVSLEQERCTQDCALECTQCNMCLHMYSCACYDHLIHGTICKHIHLVACTFPAEAALQGAPYTSTQEDTQVILHAVEQPPAPSSALGCNRLLARLDDDLTAWIRDCTNAKALSAVKRHIASATSVLKAITSQAKGVFPEAPTEPSNKMAFQRFRYTKKSANQQ